MKVKLTYFRLSGKCYSHGEYTTERTVLYNIWDEVENMKINRKLPGLTEGHNTDYIVHIVVPDHPHNHPHLIL